MGLIRNPDRCEFARAVQLGQIDRVAPVGLDPVARLAWDQRRCNHDALVAGCCQLPLDAIAARPGLVAEPQTGPILRELRHQRPQSGWRVGNLAVFTHFSPLARIRRRDRNRILVHIQTNVRDRVFHDPSPMHEARHRTSDATLVNLHTARRVTPCSGEHLV